MFHDGGSVGKDCLDIDKLITSTKLRINITVYQSWIDLEPITKKGLTRKHVKAKKTPVVIVDVY